MQRFLCPRRGSTVSLLPDCLAARVSGTLEAVEATVREASRARTLEEAANRLREPGTVQLAGAQRWLGRRRKWVRAALVTVKGLLPGRFEGTQPTLEAFGAELGSESVLRALRELASGHLTGLPPPLGFGGRSGRERKVPGTAPQPRGVPLPAPGT